MVSVSLIPSLYINYCYELTGQKQSIKIKIINSLGGVFFAILSLTPLMISDVGPILGFSYWPKAGILFPLWLSWFLLLTILGHIMLMKKSYEDRRYLYVLIGIYLAFIGGGANFLLFYNIPFPPILNGLISIYVILTTWAIVKHDAFDITLIIKRWLARLIVFALIVASFVATILFLDYNSTVLAIALSFLGLFWAYATYPAIRLLITTRARKFLKGWYEPEDVLTAISNKIEKEKSRRKIFSTIAEEIYNALEIEKLGLIIARKNSNKKLSHYLVTDRKLNELGQLELSDFILEHFIKYPKITSYKELIKILQKEHPANEVEAELKKFKTLGFSGKETYFLPFSSPEILEGLIIANEKSEGKPFRDKDITLFNLIIKQLENLFYKLTPYEQIEATFNENQKKLFEAQVQLVRAEKIAALARIIQNGNHEIRTPLYAISLATDNISGAAEPAKEAVQAYFKTIKTQVTRCMQVVDNSLELSVNAKKIPEKLDLNKTVEAALSLLPPDGFKIISTLEPIPEIMGIKSDLIGVIINLINNAKNAMINHIGNVTISTNLDPETNEVVLKIADTGKGIPTENLERIWEPYFTTNTTDGHGLGLSIVHQTVLNHKAQISVESELNVGTTFTIRFLV
jgi:signal transduction histidine kinase